MKTEMTNRKVAIVTGSNKGIGFAIVKALCEKFTGDVYLTARDKNRGLNAVKLLNEQGYHPKFHVLDITIPENVSALKDHIIKEYGGIDVLINNAAIAFKENATEPFEIQAKETLQVNYFALRDTCNILFPILNPHSRVVNISSSAGHLSNIPQKNLRDKLSSEDLTETELSNLMNSFVQAAQNNNYIELGWPSRAYSVSKVGVSALTRIQQREFSQDTNRPDIIVNSVHPGYVDTDMTSHKGVLTIEQGAEAPVYLALLPENVNKPKGDYVWYNKVIVDWVNGPLP
ncbi:hypothetical protein PGB90_003212 [Kerria lacca]